MGCNGVLSRSHGEQPGRVMDGQAGNSPESCSAEQGTSQSIEQGVEISQEAFEPGEALEQGEDGVASVTPPSPVLASAFGPKPSRTTQVQRLSNEHLVMVELVLDGLSNQEIAKKLDRSPTSVSLIVNQPLFQNELAQRRKERNRVVDTRVADHRSEAIGILEGAVVPAARTQVQLLMSSDDRVKQNACNAIFDRVYGKSLERSVNVNVPLAISQDKLSALQGVLAELMPET